MNAVPLLIIGLLSMCASAGCAYLGFRFAEGFWQWTFALVFAGVFLQYAEVCVSTANTLLKTKGSDHGE